MSLVIKDRNRYEDKQIFIPDNVDLRWLSFGMELGTWDYGLWIMDYGLWIRITGVLEY